MFWQIRKRGDGTLMETYESPTQIIKGGELGDDSQYVHLPVPEGFDPSVVDWVCPPEGEMYLEVNADKLVAWKKSKNKEAKDAFAIARENQGDADISVLIEGNAEATVLMIAMNHFLEYVKALQVAMSIEDSDLSAEGQAGKAAVVEMQTTLYTAVQQIRATRDADIAAFVPPHTDVDPLYP